MQSKNQYILKQGYTFSQSHSSTGIKECLKLYFKQTYHANVLVPGTS